MRLTLLNIGVWLRSSLIRALSAVHACPTGVPSRTTPEATGQNLRKGTQTRYGAGVRTSQRRLLSVKVMVHHGVGVASHPSISYVDANFGDCFMAAKSSAWVPPLAPLVAPVAGQGSPDAVLNDFMAAGFNFDLPPALEKTFGPRKRAYVTEVEKWINEELEWTAQWELARALARIMLRKSPHLVREQLDGVGWRFDGNEFLPIETGGIREHVFFPAGATHDAFVHVRSLFKGAKQELFIIDGYIDTSLFKFLLSTNGPTTCRVLTKARTIPHDFVAEAQHFVQQHGFTLSVRSSDIFHDRQIVLDRSLAFVLGASIKDAGKKAFHIIPIENPSTRDEMIRYAEDVWNQGIVVI
jgi:hypothetical protein